ncbi:MAG: hypothetical protein V3W34_05910, partial [Phycisphaerae bacterium]
MKTPALVLSILAAVALCAGTAWTAITQDRASGQAPVDISAGRPAPAVPWGEAMPLPDKARSGGGSRTAFGGSGSGIQSAADHIVNQQCENGGWSTGHASCASPSKSVSSPIALGLLNAYEATGDAAQLRSATDDGDLDLTFVWGNGEFRFGSFTPAFLRELSGVTANPIYSDHAAIEFFDELTAATYGPKDEDTAAWIAGLQAARSGTLINLRPWDFQNLPWVAGEIGKADSTTPADGVSQQDRFRDALLDGLDTLSALVQLDLLGLAGGIRGLALNGNTPFVAIANATDFPFPNEINGIDNLCDLAAVLLAFQNLDGSWSWRSTLQDSPGDQDTQTTAYAVLALSAAQDQGCGPYDTQIDDAREWLWTMQDIDGGFFRFPGGSHSTVVEGEALNAMGAPSLTLEVPAGCLSDTQIEVELWMRNITQVTGFQAFLEFNVFMLNYRGDLSTYTSTPFPLHIQDITTAEVSAGQLNLDGSVALGDPATTTDALLATLVFDVVADCGPTSVDFRTGGKFSSELSFGGNPLATTLVNSPSLTLDDTPPTITCPANVTVNTDAGLCTATAVALGTPTTGDNCPGETAANDG